MSVSVETNEQRIEMFYLSNKQKQGLKYLNSKRIKTHRRPCCADLCMRMDLPLDKKLWKIRTGPLGCGPPGCGPPGRRAAGPWRVVGRGPAFSKTPIDRTLSSDWSVKFPSLRLLSSLIKLLHKHANTCFVTHYMIMPFLLDFIVTTKTQL